MKTFAAAALIAHDSAISEIEFQFVNWMGQFNKNYATVEEYQFRLGQFALRYEAIQEHKADPTLTYQVAYNKFSDWTEEEFSKLLGAKYTPVEERTHSARPPSSNAAPAEWNWIPKGAVNPV